MCWGNYSGPHHHDVALGEILEPVLGANVGAYSFEGANPQHEHEWKVFEKVKLAQDKIIIPGVIDTKTNVLEHPELVAQRIVATPNLLAASGSSRAPTAASGRSSVLVPFTQRWLG